MTLAVPLRLLRNTPPRLLAKFAWNLGWKGVCAVNAFKRRVARGEHFPAFVFISPTNRCNLNCEGCWVTQTRPPVDLPPEVFHRIVEAARRKGSHFFGVLGGEPLLYPHLFEVLSAYPDCYFQVFTNGTLLTDEVAREMRRLGNVTPLVSVEGLETESDRRRGSNGVFGGAMRALAACREWGLITGVATSVCRSNYDEVVTPDFIDRVADRGAAYLWYYIYRPAGEQPSPEQALDEARILELRSFLVNQRLKAPLILVDAYWDADGQALCPAATGISHHVNPHGDIEPCPPIQFANDNVGADADVAEKFDNSGFLREFRDVAATRTRGCVLLEDPQAVAAWARQCGARNTSGRPDMPRQMAGMQPCPGHHLPGREIPERSLLYRFAKRHWFFGFGAYG